MMHSLRQGFVSIMLMLAFVVGGAQAQSVDTQSFGDLAEGPYDRLVIRGAMVIPGHGGPPVGPHDIVIEGKIGRAHV